MSLRTVEDQLREEYFGLLPCIRQATEELEAEVRHLLIATTYDLKRHERLVIRSRVKDCESAIGSLRRRQETWAFNTNRAHHSSGSKRHIECETPTRK